MIRKHYAVEVTDPHPTLGGKTIRQPFFSRHDAQIWADREVAAAQELGIGFAGVTARVILWAEYAAPQG